MKHAFELEPSFSPSGDQPAAIERLRNGLEAGNRFQTLEGVTGSGKTFTMANVIAAVRKPTLVISHNKTLAAQLYNEFREFFPTNAVEYFISYYDYYQPEAYIPQTDTYIEKDASINKEIERLRLSATNSMMYRDDIIVVASVSCIYGLGSPDDYRAMLVQVERGQDADRDEILRQLVDVQYTRNDYEPESGTFRVRGDVVDIFPSYSKERIRLEFFGDEVDAIRVLDVTTGQVQRDLDSAMISPAKHFVTPNEKLEAAADLILAELDERVAWLEKNKKLLEAQRLRMRTMYDLEMMKEVGYCSGIENYARHLSGRKPGEPPYCLLDFMSEGFLTIIDESHVTIPQLRGMYNGDQSRKRVLVEHGFRLPSAMDNRPMNFDEFLDKAGPILFMSATPAAYEREVSSQVVEQLLRPTGLLDPPVDVRPLQNQVDDLMEEVRAHAEREERVLVTTLTKRTAEDLADYLRSVGIRVEYIHSEVNAIERVEILRRLREAKFDCLVGVNLLREGLDLPEVSLVAVLDADKEGFLRSETSLLQLAGRAARHVDGKVILYADNVTDSMQRMLDVTTQRRERQMAYNDEHGITPQSVKRAITEMLPVTYEKKGEEGIDHLVARESGVDYDVNQVLAELEKEMLEAAESLEFERAAILRDQIHELKKHESAEA